MNVRWKISIKSASMNFSSLGIEKIPRGFMKQFVKWTSTTDYYFLPLTSDNIFKYNSKSTIIRGDLIMYVKEVLDDLGIRVKLPQHWYSTDVGAEFEEPKLIQNDDIIKIEAESGENTKVILIDVEDGMSVVTRFADGKVIGVKYLDNKDDFEYIGKPSELFF